MADCLCYRRCKDPRKVCESTVQSRGGRAIHSLRPNWTCATQRSSVSTRRQHLSAISVAIALHEGRTPADIWIETFDSCYAEDRLGVGCSASKPSASLCASPLPAVRCSWPHSDPSAESHNGWACASSRPVQLCEAESAQKALRVGDVGVASRASVLLR